MYFATDNKIIVNTNENDVYVFNEEGYICAPEAPCLSKKQNIILESKQTREFGKFFLLVNPLETSNKYTLLQSDKKGFNEIMSEFDEKKL